MVNLGNPIVQQLLLQMLLQNNQTEFSNFLDINPSPDGDALALIAQLGGNGKVINVLEELIDKTEKKPGIDAKLLEKVLLDNDVKAKMGSRKSFKVSEVMQVIGGLKLSNTRRYKIIQEILENVMDVAVKATKTQQDVIADFSKLLKG